MWGEIVICVIFPLMMLPLAYVVQGHRYDILEHTGCSIPVYFSWLGFVIRTFVPCFVCLVSLFYSGRFKPKFSNGC
jgi:pheromone a factor receptor